MAWLDATPETDGPRMTRREQLKDNPLSKMPDLEYPHLVEWLMDVGPCEITMHGFSPLSYSEIDAWSRLSGLELVENEANILKTLSLEYCTMFNKSRDKNCTPPYIHNCSEDDLSRTRANVEDQMRKLMKKG